MTKVDIAQICLNGHIINPHVNRFPQINKKFCDICGKETITKCPNCKIEIQGDPIIEDSAPNYCHNCGKPYPWTNTKIKVAQELIKELEELSNEDKSILTHSIDDIITDNLRTNLAIVRIKKVINRCTRLTGKILYKLFVDISSETAKKLIKGDM